MKPAASAFSFMLREQLFLRRVRAVAVEVEDERHARGGIVGRGHVDVGGAHEAARRDGPGVVGHRGRALAAAGGGGDAAAAARAAAAGAAAAAARAAVAAAARAAATGAVAADAVAAAAAGGRLICAADRGGCDEDEREEWAHAMPP